MHSAAGIAPASLFIDFLFYFVNVTYRRTRLTVAKGEVSIMYILLPAAADYGWRVRAGAPINK